MSFLYTLVVKLYLFHTIYLADLRFFQTWAYSVYDNDYHEGNHKLLIGGDFNVALQAALDCLGGNTTLKESVKFLEDILIEHDLVDIWRVRNPDRKNFTWRQKTHLFKDVLTIG